MSRLARITLACVIAVGAAACNETVEPLPLSGAPAVLLSLSGAGQVGGVGTELAAPLVVRVVDANGASVPGAFVEWTTTGGTLSQQVDTTDANGQASTELTLPPNSGTVTVTAHVDGLTDVTLVVTASPIGNLLAFRYVDAGAYHACGITTTEQAICWGFSDDGQTGTGAFTRVTPPTLVVGPLGATRITAGGRYHSCATTLAGVVYCWGANQDGRLGNKGQDPAATPQQLRSPFTFRTVVAGLTHSCAIDLTRDVWCWGNNADGELAAITQHTHADTAVFVGGPYRTVAAGGLHTCAVAPTGDMDCWGYNQSGQVGSAAPLRNFSPVPVSGGFSFLTEPATVPQAPDPDFYIPGQAFITAGYAHTCGITTANIAVCWGENENGQLGRGNLVDSNTPVAVSGGLAFKAITAGYKHTCALNTAGAAYCWGNNELGQLGDGTTTGQAAPVPVSGNLVFQSISAGETFTCGVTTAGAAWCWGDNVYGQLGQPGGISLVPLKLPFQP
jgi:alpha-tubulin suppressor-like RCC1 family protein